MPIYDPIIMANFVKTSKWTFKTRMTHMIALFEVSQTEIRFLPTI